MPNLSTNPTINPSLTQPAIDRLNAFEAASVPGAWQFLDKATLIQEMRDRLANPFAINQGGQPFCGPAAVLFELVRTQPDRYVEICQSLFTIGGFHSQNHWIGASDELRQASCGNLRMGQVDWMVLATLRESENSLFPVEPNAPDLIRNLAGMTKSWEMIGWIKEILGYTQVEYNHAYLLNDLSALQKAEAAIAAGGAVFSLITAEGLLNHEWVIPIPNHWVSILGNIQANDENTAFDIYTWSKQVHVAIDTPTFRKYFWLAITATP
jgi:hypothetical protein